MLLYVSDISTRGPSVRRGSARSHYCMARFADPARGSKLINLGHLGAASAWDGATTFPHFLTTQG